MVLKYKFLFIFCLFFLTHAAYSVSFLQQFPRDKGNKNLIITKCNVDINILGKYQNIINIDYVIRNEGEECVVTIGVVFDIDRDDHDFVPNELKFLVNDTLKEYRIEYNRLYVPAWTYDECLATIDVTFPHYEEVSINLSYKNNIWDFSMAEIGIKFDSHTSNWGSIAPLYLSIENNSNDEVWITNIEMLTSDGSENFYVFSYHQINNKNGYLNILNYPYRGVSPPSAYYLDLVIANEKKINILLDYPVERTINILWHDYDSIWAWKNIVFADSKIYFHNLVLFTANQLRIMRNAIYAKYGYIFQDRDLQQLFETVPFSQIRNIVSEVFDDSLITEVDRANIETIRQMEMIKRRSAPGNYYD
jgi:hypothetical protein